MSEPGLEAIVALRHPEPHQVLGAHADGDGTRVRAYSTGCVGPVVGRERGPPQDHRPVAARG